MVKVSEIVSLVLVIIGVIIAVVAGLFNPEQGFPFSGLILLILGLVVGFMLKVRQASNYIIAGLGLALGVGTLVTLSSLSGVLETFATAIFAHLVTLVSSMVLAVSLKALAVYLWPKFK